MTPLVADGRGYRGPILQGESLLWERIIIFHHTRLFKACLILNFQGILLVVLLIRDKPLM